MIPKEPDDDDFLMDYVDPYFGAAIADVISTWARFEYALDELIWDLAGLEPEAGACITAQYTTVANRFNSLGALARLQDCDEQFIRKLNKLKDRALGIADKRNRVAHDPWFRAYEKKEHYRLQKTSRGKLEFVYKKVTEEELKLLVVEIDTISKDFSELKYSYHTWIYSKIV